jgi:hypothetical protein
MAIILHTVSSDDTVSFVRGTDEWRRIRWPVTGTGENFQPTCVCTIFHSTDTAPLAVHDHIIRAAVASCKLLTCVDLIVLPILTHLIILFFLNASHLVWYLGHCCKLDWFSSHFLTFLRLHQGLSVFCFSASVWCPSGFVLGRPTLLSILYTTPVGTVVSESLIIHFTFFSYHCFVSSIAISATRTDSLVLVLDLILSFSLSIRTTFILSSLLLFWRPSFFSVAK